MCWLPTARLGTDTLLRGSQHCLDFLPCADRGPVASRVQLASLHEIGAGSGEFGYRCPPRSATCVAERGGA